jgi:predicted transcriptional regulator
MTTILDELRLHGPMTAVTLAARLGRVPTGVDRDLRNLAARGVVERVPDDLPRRGGPHWQVTR